MQKLHYRTGHVADLKHFYGLRLAVVFCPEISLFHNLTAIDNGFQESNITIEQPAFSTQLPDSDNRLWVSVCSGPELKSDLWCRLIIKRYYITFAKKIRLSRFRLHIRLGSFARRYAHSKPSFRIEAGAHLTFPE